MGKVIFRWVGVVVILLGLGLGLMWENDAGELRSPLEESVYVWNRHYGDGVRRSLKLADSRFDGLSVLAGEVETNFDGTHVVRSQFVDLDWAHFSQLSSPLTLCFRVQSWSGPFELEDEALVALVSMIERVLSEASAEGISVAGVQIDFDCPTSKLSGYARWLAGIRSRIQGIEFSITVLPDWLGSRSFPNLVGACDYYVLQVHSLVRPKSVDDSFSLFDVSSALSWAEKADAVGVPFQIALPTYSYELRFDEAGRFVGLSAEGGAGVQAARRRIVRADPSELAAAKVSLAGLSLDYFKGLIWFRMPVISDTLNWDWSTFDAVRSNTLEDLPVVAELMFKDARLAYVELRNPSNRAQPLPTRVVVAYSDVELVAWDALRFYVAHEVAARRELVFELVGEAGNKDLRAGEVLAIAWVRLSEAGEIECRLENEETR